MICGYVHNTMISPSHLKTHNITSAEYKARYPDAVLRVQSPEVRAKIAAAKEGKSSWNKGKKTGPNTKLSESIRGKARPNARGVKRSAEQRQRISIATKAAMQAAMTAEVKAKLKDIIKQKKENGSYVAPMSGKMLSSDSKLLISQKLKAVYQKKREEKINQFIEIAKTDNLLVESIDNDYWFNFKCVQCGSKFTFSKQAFWASKKSGQNLCPTCFPRNSGKSNMEMQLFEFIKSLDDTAIANDRIVLGGKELDIYLPERKIAFEFTGLYWHAEKQNSERNHLLWKMQHAHKQGIRLITIFEDEWLYKQDIVRSRIKSILGKSDSIIYARKCKIERIDAKLKNQFLEDNHLQGKDSSSIALGLFENKDLVAVATFKKTNIAKGGNGTVWELSRFCSKCYTNVLGGASRLIYHFMHRENTENLNLISYADRRWSDGNLYKALKFNFAGTTPSSYWYLRGYKHRIHRSALMKHRLVTSEEDYKMTEWQLAVREGYDRIWDCGTTKWILSAPPK